MKTLREAIADAQSEKRAIAHFNISNSEGFNAIVTAARKLNSPVIIGVSEKERAFIGMQQVVALVQKMRNIYDMPIYLNADHTYSVDGVKEVIDAGFDAAIFDGAQLSLAENIEKATECVKYARASGRDVLIEGEIGYIGTSSKMLDEIPAGASVGEDMLTKVTEAKEFVDKTGVDMLAPALGSIHGMLKNGLKPALSAKRTAEINQAVNRPLVLHGGSGSSHEDMQAVIASGVSVLHINTELRVAFRKGLEESLRERPDDIAPYAYMQKAQDAMQQVAEDYLKLVSMNL